MNFFSDAIHKKGLNVARRSYHEIWSVIAYRSQRNNFWLLRWVDRWSEVPSRHGRFCGQRKFPFITTECEHAIQAGVRGGWLFKKLIALESDWNWTDGFKLHTGRYLKVARVSKNRRIDDELIINLTSFPLSAFHRSSCGTHNQRKTQMPWLSIWANTIARTWCI